MRPTASLLLFATLTLTTMRARAADDANVVEARTLFKEGVRLYEASDFEHARVKFAAAHALVKSADIVWNLALAEARSGHAVDAMNHLRLYARDPHARSSDMQEALSKWIPLLEPQVGELDVDGAEGAHVTVDGESIGELPLPGLLAVTPGRHRVEGRIGTDVTVRDVDVAKGTKLPVHLAPVPPPSNAVAAPLVAAPAAAAPVRAPDPEPPTPPTTTTTDADVAAREAPHLRAWMTAGLAVGAVALAGGFVYFRVRAGSAQDDVDRLHAQLPPGSCPSAPGCAELSGAIDDHNARLTTSNVLGVGALVLGAGAVASWLFLPRGGASSTALAPIAGPGVAGLRLMQSF